MNIYLEIYLFILINLVIFFIFKNYRLEKILFILTLSGLFIFSGTRYFTGVDYESYLNVFRDVDSRLNLRGIEKIFLFIVFYSKKIFKSELKYIFLLFEFINMFLLYKLIVRNLSKNLFIALYIWYCFYFLRLNMGQFRFGMAILLCLNLISYLYNSFYRKFFLGIILSFYIHKTSIIYFLLFFIKKNILSKKNLLYLPLIAFFIGKILINKQILIFIGDLTNSVKLKSMVYGKYIFNVKFSFYQLYIILILILLYFYKTKNLKINFFKDVFSLGVVMYFLFINLAIFSDRLSLIFISVQTILFPMIINDLNKKMNKIIIILFLIIICSYTFFSTIFGNLAEYIPYKSWLL